MAKMATTYPSHPIDPPAFAAATTTLEAVARCDDGRDGEGEGEGEGGCPDEARVSISRRAFFAMSFDNPNSLVSISIDRVGICAPVTPAFRHGVESISHTSVTHKQTCSVSHVSHDILVFSFPERQLECRSSSVKCSFLYASADMYEYPS